MGGRGEASKIPILGNGMEIMGHFPEYDVIRGGGEASKEQKKRHETYQNNYEGNEEISR